MSSRPDSLALHARADELASSPTAVAEALSQALQILPLTNRTKLAVQLRSVLHECLAQAAADELALKCWESVISGSSFFSSSPLRPAGVSIGTSDVTAVGPPSSSATGPGIATGFGTEGEVGTDTGIGLAPHFENSVSSVCLDEAAPDSAFSWSSETLCRLVLSFCVSVDALGDGLLAVSKMFRHVALQPECWQRHVVTFEERQFRGATIRGDIGWGKAFALLPTLRAAQTIRVGCITDNAVRSHNLKPLRSCCSKLCSGVQLLSCTFCEHHLGANIELPTPRQVTALRRRSSEAKGGGMVLGNGPVEADPEGTRSFRVFIESMRPEERLDIGVTSLAPHEQFVDRTRGRRTHRQVNFAEDLRHSWIIESSGLLVGSHAGLRIRSPDWDARQLRVGDEITLQVAASGELSLAVNGFPRGFWRAQIPADRPIFPVLDLFEGWPKVHLRMGAGGDATT